MKKITSISIMFFFISIINLFSMDKKNWPEPETNLSSSFNEKNLPSRNKRIIVDGAPRSGKTSTLERLKSSTDVLNFKKQLKESDTESSDSFVSFLEETAGEIIEDLINQGINIEKYFQKEENLINFQIKIINKQIKKETEQFYTENEVIIQDRSLVSIYAYVQIYFNETIKKINKKILKENTLTDIEKEFMDKLEELITLITSEKNSYEEVIFFEKNPKFQKDKKRIEKNQKEVTQTENLLKSAYKDFGYKIKIVPFQKGKGSMHRKTKAVATIIKNKLEEIKKREGKD
jgi:predicted ATPase